MGQRERWQRRKSKGLCIHCPDAQNSKAVKGTLFCQFHLDKHNSRSRKYRKDHPVKMKKAAKKRQRDRRLLDVCIGCGSRVMEKGKQHCTQCLKAFRENTARWHIERILRKSMNEEKRQLMTDPNANIGHAVWVRPKGRRYHVSGCQMLDNDEYNAIPLMTAFNTGYRPCSCVGDKRKLD